MTQYRLPRIRGDLQLTHTDAATGSTLHDPLRHRFYHLDTHAAAMVKAWPRCQSVGDLIEVCERKLALPVTEDAVMRFGQWLAQNELTDPVEEAAWRGRATSSQRQEHCWLVWVVHNYLFIKIPLLDPQQMLAAGLPWLAPIFTRAFFAVVGCCGALGLYLAGREWDQLMVAFADILTLQSGPLFILSLALVKSLHELGHAVTAARFGCRVPTMGICLMVLTPMLYTDVSDAWRLPSRRQRILVDLAGVLVEISIACFSLLAWTLLPDGPLKWLTLILATTSLFMSIALNLNPFTRFDGYYLLIDLLGIANLQSRSFAMARWKLREMLFATRIVSPERLAVRTIAAMILYAWMVWLYRLIVFTGIAIFVYASTFKLLGIALFLIEIIYFIAWPIWHELREWWRLRKAIVVQRRFLGTIAVFGMTIVTMLVPWSTRVNIPAVMEAGQISQLYPRRAAYVVESSAVRGSNLEAGSMIVALVSPELDQELRLTDLRLRQMRQRLARRPADGEERAQSQLLETAAAALESKRAGLEAERAELLIAAPHAGRIVELEPSLHVGRWLQRSDLVALVRGSGEQVVRGYVGESDVGRLITGALATFLPEAVNEPAQKARIVDVSPTGVGSIDIPELASAHGGGLLARWRQRPGEARGLVPVEGQYMVTARLESDQGEFKSRSERGVLIADGRPESFSARTWRHILKVLLRESGF